MEWEKEEKEEEDLPHAKRTRPIGRFW